MKIFWLLFVFSICTFAQSFSVVGLTSPATVSGSIFVQTSGLGSGATVTFYIDGQVVGSSGIPPYALNKTAGFAVASLSAGPHVLTATATVAKTTVKALNSIQMTVVPALASLSNGLTPYQNHPTAQSQSPTTILANTTTRGATLSAIEQSSRKEILALFLNWGIDPSLNFQEAQSTTLENLLPTAWMPATTNAPRYLYSPDAPFYQRIPAAWPRVQLPAGYIQTAQVNAVHGGDGIGFGIATGKATDPLVTITSQWYGDTSTRVSYSAHIPTNWKTMMPVNTGGDQHMIFVDNTTRTTISTYKTSATTKGISALYAAPPTPLNSLGDHGGSTASKFAELPLMIKPGEVSDASNPIGHAIGGPVGRVWKARVYPATAWDAEIDGVNTCTGSGFMNTGLVPYGGVIQLDPNLQLSSLGLSLPAFRILEAMQQYGYYVMDFGCGDFDIYTSFDESEVQAWGGMYGSSRGPGIQNEVQRVIATAKLYVVAPLLKKQ